MAQALHGVNRKDLWKKAVVEVEEAQGKSEDEFSSREYVEVTAAYLKLGGGIGRSDTPDKKEESTGPVSAEDLLKVLDSLNQ